MAIKAITDTRHPRYSREAVQAEIDRARRRKRVSAREAMLIHSILKGRDNG